MIPYFPFFAWYHVFSYYILKFVVGESSETFSIYYASFYFLVSFALILGSSFVHRIDKTSVTYACHILLSIGTIFIALAPTRMLKLMIYFLSGVIFGIGLLTFFTIFWDLTVPEERGRVAGLIGSFFLPIFPFIVILADNLDFFRIAALCIILNLGSLTIKPLNPKKITMLTRKKDLKGYNPEKRTTLLYLVPWAIYSLINATLAKAVSFNVSQYVSPSSLMLLWHLQVISGGLGAIIGGAIADFFGRRYSLALGLTLYGISSAISGLAKSYEMFSLMLIGTGLTWGILLTLYLFVVWGDLGTTETCTYGYSIGLAVFYSTAGVGSLFSTQLFQIPLVVASITNCLLIFLSNAPLILAPELLPSDFREKIRLKLYIHLLRRKKLKYLSNHG